MRCVDCAKYPFCHKIVNPNDEACNDGIKRPIEEEISKVQ